MVEGIEGGDAAGPADRLGKEWWAGGGGCGAVLGAIGVGVGRRPARAPALVVLDFWRRKQRRNQYNVQS